MLQEGIDVMRGWGFKYKTSLFWNKERYGLGYWFRGQVEMCLLGTRGRYKAFRSKERNIFNIPKTKHSQKPIAIQQLITERAWGTVRSRDTISKRARATLAALYGWIILHFSRRCRIEQDKMNALASRIPNARQRIAIPLTIRINSG